MTRSLLLCALLFGSLTWPGTVRSQSEPAVETETGSPALSLPLATTDAGLAPYVDGLVEGVRARDRLPGVIVSVVRSDRVLHAAGYGLANVESERSADADSTMFRIASISKTFTYTAAMQLIERGHIGLEDPVNQHLPEALQLPDDGYAEPIRIRHLLSHTAGFEDSALGHLFARESERVLTPEQYLVQHRPRRVRTPGAIAVYSNYSLAVLGAVIAHVSGQRFEDYIEQHLTGPLAMARTTFREPLPEADPRRLEEGLAADLAQGYRRGGGRFRSADFEFIAHGAAAGGASSTAADMARWMRVHLNEGELDGVRILSRDNTVRMREILFRNAPDVPGIGHGFLTWQFGPHFAYGHGGATLSFHSAMLMLPELDLGVFVSTNGANGRAPVLDLTRLIIEYLTPADPLRAATIAMSAEELSRFSGEYRNNRRAFTTAEMAVMNLGRSARVDHDDGALLLHLGGPEPLRMLPIGPLSFREADGDTRAQFFTDTAGRIHGFTHGFGINGYDRVSWLESRRTLFIMLAITSLIAVVRLWRGWRRHKRYHPPRPGLFPVKALSMLSALVWLLFIAVAVTAGLKLAAEGSQAVFTYPSPWLLAALALATAAAVATALEVLAIAPVLRSQWQAWPKLRYMITVALLAFTVYILWTWNLIGMRV